MPDHTEATVGLHDIAAVAADRVRLADSWRLCLAGSVLLLLSRALPATAGAADQATPADPAAATLRIYGARQAAASGAASDRLDGTLALVAQRYQRPPSPPSPAELHALNPAARFRLAAPQTVPEVLIDAVTGGDVHALQQALQHLGLRDAAVFANDVGGWLPVDQLGAAAGLAQLRSARASLPQGRRGPVATQGDFVQGTAAIRATFGNLTGSGITVGVLSDSFNCYATYAAAGLAASGYSGFADNGFAANYASDQASGALPSGVNVLQEASCLDYGAPEQPPYTDEGRAILQIVHAVAPGAQLAFFTADNSEAGFAAGILELAEAGARIIDDDVGYFDEPYFQDGIVAQAIDQVSALGVAYFSSAGNDARVSYENSAPVFPVSAAGGANSGEQLLNFDVSGATTATSLPVTIPSLYPGEFVALVLEWDQPYVTGAPQSGGATSVLDLCVQGAPGADQIDYQAASGALNCSGPNALGADAVQVLIIGNPASAPDFTPAVGLGVQVGLANGTLAPGRIKLALLGDGAPVSIDQFATDSPTIQGHPMAAGAMAVGAADYLNTPPCGAASAQLEPFSSAGGDPILFSASGQRLAVPVVRQKPQLVGPDGVNDSFLGRVHPAPSSIAACVDSDTFPSFFGTSAAAPHAAAAAALMLQANRATTAAQIFAALQASALPMGSVPNFDAGYGLIQAVAALAQLPPPAPSITVTPLSVPLGGSATLVWSAVSTSSCTASGGWSGAQATLGQQRVTPSAAGSVTYTLACSGSGGSSSASATLAVDPPGGSGGGGSLDAASLLALAAARWLRRAGPRRCRR